MAVYRTTFAIGASAETVWKIAGDREFAIDAQPDGTVLFPLFRAAMGRAIQRGHDAFNAALKNRAEGHAPTTSP